MERRHLAELHYITPIENVPSILQHGILSHNRAARLPHRSIAMQEIQDRRERVVVPNGRRLHDYANLYVCGRNPMLFKRQGERDAICVLAVDPAVLDLPGVVVTDQNASTQYTRFEPAPGGLRIVNRDRTFAEYWTDEDPIEYFRKKAAKCAEILVPDRVEARFVLRAYVANSLAQERFQSLGTRLNVSIDRHLFFL